PGVRPGTAPAAPTTPRHPPPCSPWSWPEPGRSPSVLRQSRWALPASRGRSGPPPGGTHRRAAAHKARPVGEARALTSHDDPPDVQVSIRLGTRLRDLRRQLHLSLQDVEVASNHEFK